MKKLALLLLVIVLAATYAVPAGADEIDYSYIKDHPDVFELDINEEGNAFISLDFGKPGFTHKNSVENYVSLFYSDIIVVDYYSASPAAYWRLWIGYSAAKSLGITGITFRYGDSEYYFKVAEDVEVMKDDDIVIEEFPIVMGSDNLAFWMPLILDLENAENYDAVEQMDLTAILHGAIDDVEFKVSADTLVNIYFMGEAIINMIGGDAVLATAGTPVTVK